MQLKDVLGLLTSAILWFPYTNNIQHLIGMNVTALCARTRRKSFASFLECKSRNLYDGLRAFASYFPHDEERTST